MSRGARIELDDFITGRLIERTYRRMMELQDRSREPFWNGGRRARRLRDIGVRMAMDRNPHMMLFLERSTEYMRARSDEQKSTVGQMGYEQVDEMSEAALFRTAYEKADEPNRDPGFLHATLGWVFAAVAEALGH